MKALMKDRRQSNEGACDLDLLTCLFIYFLFMLFIPDFEKHLYA